MPRGLLPLILWTALSGCGSDEARVSALPSGSDAAVDTGKTSTTTDAARDTLVADAGCMTCAGAPMPTWALTDFEPKSPGYGKTYGLETFKGKVTVVALLASW